MFLFCSNPTCDPKSQARATDGLDKSGTASANIGMSDLLTPKSGFADLVNYHLSDWRENYAELTLTVEARHLNRSRVMHGGVLATLIDAACGYAGCYSAEPDPPRRAFTLSLSCKFIGSAEAGSELLVQATRTGGGKSIFFATAEVADQDGRLIGRGDAVYKYLRT